jgi:hypothetical protein
MVPNVLVGVLVFFGGICQFLAGIMEFIAGNTVRKLLQVLPSRIESLINVTFSLEPLCSRHMARSIFHTP